MSSTNAKDQMDVSDSAVPRAVESQPLSEPKVPEAGFLTDKLASMSQVFLGDIGVALPETFGRMFLVQADHPERTLVIPISLEQASQLATVVHKIAVPRPLSHQFFLSVLGGFDLRVELVAITGKSGGNYLGEVTFSSLNGQTKTFPARPSDAVLMALSAKPPAPIMVDASLLTTSPSGPGIS